MKKTMFHTSRISLPLVAFLALSSFGLAQQRVQPSEQGDQSKLVQMVREATKQYLDVNNAVKDGYEPFLGCVSGSDHGAMGTHYVNGNLLQRHYRCQPPASPDLRAVAERYEAGRRRIHYLRFGLGAEQLQSSSLGRPGVPVRRQPKPVQHTGLLRASRMGVAGQPARRFRGLERPRDLRT